MARNRSVKVIAGKVRVRITRRARWLARRQPAPAFRIASNELGMYCVPTSSRRRPASRAVLLGAVYEPETIDAIVSSAGAGDVVHAGTYFGDFLPALSKGCAAGAKVWAFEPNAESFRCAQITVLLNDLTNVELRNAGLGAVSTSTKIQIADSQGKSLGGGSKIVADGADATGTETVQIRTIDESVPADRNVTVLQLDVEGYEQQALAGALQTIARCRPTIILEELPGSTLLASDWFRDNIRSLGYAESRRIHHNVVFACR